MIKHVSDTVHLDHIMSRRPADEPQIVIGHNNSHISELKVF